MLEILTLVFDAIITLSGLGLIFIGGYGVWRTRHDSPDWQVIPHCQVIMGLVIMSFLSPSC